ncbi:transposable element Tcb2 transposase [Trichonephila clavipes]|nr:transposable element Tcb2 transposase [Trichonephila clavipes]
MTPLVTSPNDAILVTWCGVVVRNGGVSSGVVLITTSGSERYHLQDHQAQNALDRPVVEKITTSSLTEEHLGSRCLLRVLPLTANHRRLRLEWCHERGNWTAAEQNQVVFSDEFRFNFSNDDNRVRVWRPRGERLKLAFALQLHTASTAGEMVWRTIAYNTRSPLVLIRGTMTAQRYVHDILQTHVLSLIQRLPGVIFQQDNARPHTKRVSHYCHHTVNTLSWLSRSPDLSPIEHMWYHLGR